MRNITALLPGEQERLDKRPVPMGDQGMPVPMTSANIA
ncbi:hypothetical protein GGR33_000642 [Methylobacterium brachythecii]|uniref:Uncharacterized protein n=1 Tax=Methylobacterium brachythecii TaxID=1176177 RepID=A0A7W6F5B5_9HYPH|nr:hypothetical protein [Methylobacterium brachythecii]